MPRVTRRRTIAAAPQEIWKVVADPYHLPRWWPDTQRVENVTGSGRGTKWTQVLATRDGRRGVRADYRCVGSTRPVRFAFEQIVEGSPFEKFLRASQTEIKLEPEDAGTRVTLTADQQLRGLSRFGGLMMRRAAKRRLSDALDGLDEAVGA